MKPLDSKRFFHAMDSAMGQIGKGRKNQIVMKVAGGIRQIQPNDIIYCESQKNYQMLYLSAGEYRVRMTTGKLWEMLEVFCQFGRCGRFTYRGIKQRNLGKFILPIILISGMGRHNRRFNSLQQNYKS